MGNPVSSKRLLVLVGATAVGKTDISIEIAANYGCPILSADSRQCYRELGVATAKPTSEMLERVPHYFIDTHSIHNPVSVADFEQYALSSLDEIFKHHDTCVMTGGSGLYVKALCEGLDEIPPVPASIRQQLEKKLEEKGLPELVSQLVALDPALAETIDTVNPRRVVRALEVCLGTGRPFSSFRTGEKQPRSFHLVKLGLSRDRNILYRRINLRVDQMIAQRLFEEAAELYEFRHLKPLQTVGYQEIFGFMEKLYDRKEAIRLLKRNSRRYAKRQLTWFGRDRDINWFRADDRKSIMKFLKKVAPETRS